MIEVNKGTKMHQQTNIYAWAVIGAGPAGMASIGLLLDQGVDPKNIAWIDPQFKVGDFGQYWGEVYSNTTVATFLTFLKSIKGFAFDTHKKPLTIETRDAHGFCQLKEVTQALQGVTDYLLTQVRAMHGLVKELCIREGAWQLKLDNHTVRAEKVILATGADPKTLHFDQVKEISLIDALNPRALSNLVHDDDTVAVFGSSHSSMIIMKNLLDAGVKHIHNYYLVPHRYAVPMHGWTLYDNTGLKGATAAWVRENISKQLHPAIERFISDPKVIEKNLKNCSKAIYPVGFKARAPQINAIDVSAYDKHTGIIAPGLFGTGIAFPHVKTDPLGNQELRVGLFKFMEDIGEVMPVWMQYGL